MSVQHNNYVRPAKCECMTLLVCEKHFHDRIISLRGDFINKQLNENPAFSEIYYFVYLSEYLCHK